LRDICFTDDHGYATLVIVAIPSTSQALVALPAYIFIFNKISLFLYYFISFNLF